VKPDLAALLKRSISRRGMKALLNAPGKIKRMTVNSKAIKNTILNQTCQSLLNNTLARHRIMNGFNQTIFRFHLS
jgi:hypothetical protein